MKLHVITSVVLGFAVGALTLPAAALQPPMPVDPSQLQTLEQGCAKYADDAVAQHRENLRLKCGHSGLAWHEDHNLHKQWCLDTKGRSTQSESRKRQAALKACRESACRSYAQAAVRQQQENTQRSCGYSGPAWNASFNHHYQWCVHGENQRRTANEDRRRATLLARCVAKAPLDGDFRITGVIPHVAGPKQGRYLQTVDIIVEATSAKPWIIGDYGHHKYGSLWAEVTVNAKVAPYKAVQDNRRTYLFSIRGTAADTQAFVTPHSGQKVGAGTRTLKVTVAPMPRIPLTGVERMFSVPSQPFGPGELGCWYFDPDVSVKVFIVTTANLATVRGGKSKPIMNATMIRIFDPPKGGFGKGVVSSACR